VITDLKPYPMYRDTGVEWLGQVPSGWEVRRQSNLMELRISNVDKHQVQGERPILLCNYIDVYRRDRIRADIPFSSGTALGSEIERFRLRRGDVLITKDSESWEDIASPALVEHDADDLVCGYHLAILRPRPELSGEYLFRVSQSVPVASQYQVSASGVTRFGLTQGDIKEVEVPLPPLEDQIAIARFLDYVDSRIQRLIAAQERLIELLNEEKKAIIDDVVARGLDSGASFKPSGMDLLGDIPGSWGVCRLKRLASRVTSGSRGWSTYAADDGPRFVRIANLTRGSTDLDWSDTMHLSLPADVREGEGRRTQVMHGDLLLSITAYIGSVAVVPADIGPAYVSQHVALCRLLAGVNPFWVGYVLLSSIGQNHGRLTMYGGTKQGLSLEDVGSYPILTPPLDEQADLVAWIDSNLAEVEQLVERRHGTVALLHEYRTRLISDVVTGKLDVREAAATLPDEPDVADPALDERLEEVAAGEH
jgi:type I restriction enzyme, S subunit